MVSRFSSSAERQDDREVAEAGDGSQQRGTCLAFPAWGPQLDPFLCCEAQPAATSLVLQAIHQSQRHEPLFGVPEVGSQLTGAGREGTARRGLLALYKMVPISSTARCCGTWRGGGDVFCLCQPPARAGMLPAPKSPSQGGSSFS